MAAPFDQLMRRADDRLFEVFGECGLSTYRDPAGLSPPAPVEAIVSRDIEVAGADGVFRAYQLVVELRLHQVPAPKRGGRLTLPGGAYLLEEPIRTDGLVALWSLQPTR
ncbi:hypothetical protein DN820_01815 [Stutzerimonas nosocomialis]|uniref:Uncharacterized protein n=1 Tax=Stutzerimonas nosocomialis TaxID=1056496 RepID=A0A5R9QIF9_9GAMM|nr:hypothetical protein [Stutzerimonas nosocomialis]TLX65074.1 hypothetical protein DN820_01815 [Stutzerimonas nosocomialis]